jgi:hypothetical protein
LPRYASNISPARGPVNRPATPAQTRAPAF